MEESKRNLLRILSDNKKFIGAIYELSAHHSRKLYYGEVFRDLYIKPESTEREILGWVFTVAILLNTKTENDGLKVLENVFEVILKNRIKIFKQLLIHHAPVKNVIKNHIKEVDDSINMKVIERRKHDKNSMMWGWEDIHIEELVWYKEQLKKALIITQTIKDNPTITDNDIERAKEYDINQMIDFKRNFASCIFDHEDKTPSMKYYPLTNSVYCFSCGRSADAISVYRKLNNTQFIDAVRFLIK